MMTSGYAKTNLDEQERIIADWKKERGFVEATVINNDPLKKRDVKQAHSNLFIKTDKEKQQQAERRKFEANRNRKHSYVSQKNVNLTSPKSIDGYKPFFGQYAIPHNTTQTEIVLRLLDEHAYLDVDKLITQAKFKRDSFLVACRTLEKQGRIRIIRSQESGSPVKFLECVA